MIEPMLGSWRKRVSMAGVLGLLVPSAVVALSLNAMAQSPSPSASGTPSLPGDPAKGEQLYAKTCVTCHGASLEGNIGPRLNPIQKLSGVQDPLDPQYLITTITDGRPASDGFPAMPPKGGNANLSDQDIKDLAAYIIKVNREPGGAPLSPAELARSNVFWVSVGIASMLVITYLLAAYNMRWIARRATARRNR
jgi:mono/diheme cytochrome c family protein